MQHLRALKLIAQTVLVAGVVGFGLFVVGHLTYALFTWSLPPIEWNYMWTSIVFPAGTVLVIALIDLRTIYEMANE